MWKYVRLLRIHDQYTQTGFAVAAGLFLQDRSVWLVWWILAVLCISFAVFIVNEVTDMRDTDIYSWNKGHIPRNVALDMRIVWILFFALTTLGLFFSHLSDLFVWGVSMFFIGLFYSLPPVRLKARLGGDIVAQLAVWFWIPFIAPIAKSGNLSAVVPMLFPLSCIVWSVFYPYQLADFVADKKAGLANTHVLLGLRRSVIFGCLLGVAGLVWFAFQPFLLVRHPYFFLLALMQGIGLGFYGYWLTRKNEKVLTSAVQTSIRMVKPFAPSAFIWWGIWWLVW